MQHDLALRAVIATSNGLQLRARSAAHLKSLAAQREYLVIRYGPELAGTTSKINRMVATLDEVARKVTRLLDPPPRCQSTVGSSGARP